MTRVILLGFDATLVAVLVAGLFSGDNHWYNYLQLVSWAWVTASFGWLMPKSVDEWRSGELGSSDSGGA